MKPVNNANSGNRVRDTDTQPAGGVESKAGGVELKPTETSNSNHQGAPQPAPRQPQIIGRRASCLVLGIGLTGLASGAGLVTAGGFEVASADKPIARPYPLDQLGDHPDVQVDSNGNQFQRNTALYDEGMDLAIVGGITFGVSAIGLVTTLCCMSTPDLPPPDTRPGRRQNQQVNG